MTHSHDRWSAALFIRNIEHEHSCTSDRRKSALWLIGMTHRKRASKSGTECARKMHDKEWLLFDQGWNEERVWRVVFTVRDYPDRFDRAQPDLSGPSELVIVAKNCCIPPSQVATRFSSKLNKEILFWEIWLVNQWELSSEHSQMYFRWSDFQLNSRLLIG